MKETAVKALNSISFAKQHLRERVTTVKETPARKKLDRAMELLSEAERIIEDAEEIECPPGETELEELKLTVRTYNCLRRRGIKTVEELCRWTESDVIRIRGLGNLAFNEIKDALKARGLSMRKPGQ